MMIRRLHVQNFLSLRDTYIDFDPLTILVGPNASGKSAIIKVLVTLSRLLHGTPLRGPQGVFQLEQVTLDEVVWKSHSDLPIVFRVWFEDDLDDAPGYVVELRKGGAGWSVARERLLLSSGWFDTQTQVLEHPTERRGPQRWQVPLRATLATLLYPYRYDQAASHVITPFLDFVANKFGQAWRYRPSASDIATYTPESRETQSGRRDDPYVHENGWGLSWALRSIKEKQPDLFARIQDELCRQFAHIQSIDPQSDRPGVRLAFRTTRSEGLVPAPMESDGVLHTLLLLWRLHTAGPLVKPCFEEPENGTHPYLIPERYRLLRRFAFQKEGPVQILVATHSPDFLGAIDPEDALEIVRTVEFDPGAGTIVRRLRDVDQVTTLLEVFDSNLGDLWWSGAIGAVPRL